MEAVTSAGSLLSYLLAARIASCLDDGQTVLGGTNEGTWTEVLPGGRDHSFPLF